ncbi:undecaprenyl-diphosphate phosphatase [Bacillus timonensis]|nr:undecaprenyl-diphosphate phosphatase [Bacillus timonensis]
MDWLEAIILGIIQGLTEFLPISSTGHLYLGRNLFGLNEAGLFLDTMLHIGTFIALVIFYRDIILKVIKNPFSKLTLLLMIGTLPAVAAGLLFSDYFEEISTTGATIGWEFLITGGFLWFADSIKKGSKKLDQITLTDSFVIGSFQALAIFPAISRSGLTIVGALLRKIEKETAAYFSFLLSLPAIFGAILLQSSSLVSGEHSDISLTSLLLATIASGIFGYIAVKFMINFVKTRSLKIFAVYVWVLGGSIIILQTLNIF